MSRISVEKWKQAGFKVGKAEDFYTVNSVLQPFGNLGYSVIFDVQGENIALLTDFGNVIIKTVEELKASNVVPLGLTFVEYDENNEPLFVSNLGECTVLERLERQLKLLRAFKKDYKIHLESKNV